MTRIVEIESCAECPHFEENRSYCTNYGSVITSQVDVIPGWCALEYYNPSETDM